MNIIILIFRHPTDGIHMLKLFYFALIRISALHQYIILLISRSKNEKNKYR
jgi:hypothetical protein